MAFIIIDLEDIQVAYVKVNGPSEASKAFAQLESKVGNLRGKKFYGVFYKDKGEYRACVQLDENQPDSMGFDVGVVPRGKYIRTKIENWSGKEHAIGPTFDELAKESTESGHQIDPTRPLIEFYKNQRELFLLLPIKQ